jgi:hypothetical protein
MRNKAISKRKEHRLWGTCLEWDEDEVKERIAMQWKEE